MLETSAPNLLLDLYRVPYQVVPDGPIDRKLMTGIQASNGRGLFWPSPSRERAFAGAFRLGPALVVGGVVSDADLAPALLTDGWHRGAPVVDLHDERIASVWIHESGSIFLPFDPGEVIRDLLRERYLSLNPRASRLRKGGKWAYYRVRAAVPRSGQIGIRRAFARVQGRRRFPRWPIEAGLHDLGESILGYLAAAVGRPVPWLRPWPAPYSWAFVVTHDVETPCGLQRLPTVTALEEALGYRSSWNLVPERDYRVSDELVRDLTDSGFEVGVHGFHHDGRDLESLEMLRRRLPGIRAYAERWGAVGFRSASLHRRWEFMALLGFDYDSSYPDTDPYEPDPGGCCSWLPFFIGDTVELPVTLVQDHTWFVILGRRGPDAWIDKAAYLRDRGGLALLLTHPEYLVGVDRLAAYRELLLGIGMDDGAWRALPREIASWWRRRAASRPVPDGDGWTIEGPAAGEAQLALAQANLGN